MTSRNYCFTSFTVSQWDQSRISQLMLSPTSKIRYLVYQFEECPTTSRLHVQGYIEFISPVREVAVKNFFSDPHMRLFKRDGSPSQARHYCMCSGSSCDCGDERRFKKIVKDGPYEFGYFGITQGKNTGLLTVQSALNNGATIKDVAINHFPTFARYEHAIRSYQSLNVPPRNFKTELHIYWGSSDMSTAIKETIYTKHPLESFYPLTHGNAKTLWFDGYEPGVHDNIYFENYNGWVDFDSLLAMAGSLPYNMPTKGSSIPFTAKRIYIHSHLPPKTWYNETFFDLSALFRLVTSAFRFRPPQYLFESNFTDLSTDLFNFYNPPPLSLTIRFPSLPPLPDPIFDLSLAPRPKRTHIPTLAVTTDPSLLAQHSNDQNNLFLDTTVQSLPEPHKTVILDPYTLQPMDNKAIKKLSSKPTSYYGRQPLDLRPSVPDFLGVL